MKKEITGFIAEALDKIIMEPRGQLYFGEHEKKEGNKNIKVKDVCISKIFNFDNRSVLVNLCPDSYATNDFCVYITISHTKTKEDLINAITSIIL